MLDLIAQAKQIAASYNGYPDERIEYRAASYLKWKEIREKLGPEVDARANLEKLASKGCQAAQKTLKRLRRWER